MIYEQFQFVDAPLLNRCKEFRNTLFEYRIGVSDPVIFLDIMALLHMKMWTYVARVINNLSAQLLLYSCTICLETFQV